MNTIDQIRQEIEDCEAVQNSNESDYTKEQAKLSAYEHIREIVCGKEQEE
jgi:flagellar biosynthesis chaperone FliJ